MLKTSLHEHVFPKADETWLRHCALSSPFDPRIARAQLHSKLPSDFSPDGIDRRFYRDDKLTLLGLKRFKPDDPLLKSVELIAHAVRDAILAAPGIDEVDLNQLSTATGLASTQALQALGELANLVPFFPGSQGGNPPRYFLQGTRGYNGPLQFTTLDEVLDRVYRSQHFWNLVGLPSIPDAPEIDDFEDTTSSSTQRSPVKKRTAFVIMAMDPSKPELTDVLESIRAVCKSFGITAHRADEIQHQEQITNVILEEIRSCEFLIADLTHERPNVYYEIGYAHAMDKKPILYRRSGTPLHFDLAVHNVPEYKNNTELRELLTRRLEAILGRTAAS